MAEVHIPYFEMRVDQKETSGTGVYCVSLVTDPAIELGFVAMSKTDAVEAAKFANQPEAERFAAVDGVGDYKGYVVGPLLVPDFDIFRLTATGMPYYIRFTKESIVDIRDKFFKTHSHRNTNEQHSVPLGGNTIVESQIVDNLNKSYWDQVMGYDVPVGAWMAKMKIEDTEFFNREILGKNLLGFSIEGWFDYAEITDSAVKASKVGEQVKAAADHLNSKNETQDMKNPLFGAIAKLFKGSGGATLKKHELEDGTFVVEVDETKEPFKLNTDTETLGDKLEDGDHKLADGSTLVVADGKVTELKPAEVVPAEPAMSTEEAVTAMCKELGIDAQKFTDAAKAKGLLHRSKTEKFTAVKAKLCKSEDIGKIKASIVTDAVGGKPMFVDQANGRISYIDDMGGYLYTGDYVPAGTYTLLDGTTIVVEEKMETYGEGTDWEYSITHSYVDFEASTVDVAILIPWLKKASSPLAELSAMPKIAELTKQIEGRDTAIAALGAQVEAMQKTVEALKAAPAAQPVALREQDANIDPKISKTAQGVSRLSEYLRNQKKPTPAKA